MLSIVSNLILKVTKTVKCNEVEVESSIAEEECIFIVIAHCTMKLRCNHLLVQIMKVQ